MARQTGWWISSETLTNHCHTQLSEARSEPHERASKKKYIITALRDTSRRDERLGEKDLTS